MKAKMMIYAEILRQLAQMPNEYEEPDMEAEGPDDESADDSDDVQDEGYEDAS